LYLVFYNLFFIFVCICIYMYIPCICMEVCHLEEIFLKLKSRLKFLSVDTQFTHFCSFYIDVCNLSLLPFHSLQNSFLAFFQFGISPWLSTSASCKPHYKYTRLAWCNSYTLFNGCAVTERKSKWTTKLCHIDDKMIYFMFILSGKSDL